MSRVPSVREVAQEVGMSLDEETEVLLAVNELHLEFCAEDEEDENGRSFRESQRMNRMARMNLKGKSAVLYIAATRPEKAETPA